MRRAATVSAIALLGLASRGEAQEAPCADCIVWSASVREATDLVADAASLRNARLLLVATPGDDEGERVEVALALRRQGARLALLAPTADAADARLAGLLEAVVLEPPPVEATHPAVRIFAIKQRAAEWRGVGAPRIGVRVHDAEAGRLRQSLGAYVDFLVRPGGPTAPSRDGSWVEVDPPPAASAETLLRSTRGAGEAVLVPLSGVGTTTRQAVEAARPWLPAGLTALPEVTVACPGASAPCGAEVFLHPASLQAIAWVRAEGTPVPQGLEVRPHGREVGRLALESGALLRISGWSGAAEGFADSVDVGDRLALTVEEILSRHHAWSAAQGRLIRTVISHGRMTLAFRVPGLAAPMTVSSTITLLRGPDATEMAHSGLRLNDVAVRVGADGVPRLPLVEAERAGAAPLVLSLDERYRYRLLGRETVAGREAYVVAFTPAGDGHTLPSGRAWITADTFALARMESARRALPGPIVSTWQRDDLAPHRIAGGEAWLPERTEVHDAYEGPGHRTPVDRLLVFSRHEANVSDHEARRAALHASEAVVMRETEAGWTYLRRTAAAGTASGGRPSHAGPSHAGPAAPVLRQPAGRATRVWSLAVGALVDPNIDHPLPFAGLSYVDLDFLGTGTQLSTILAGPFLQAAWSAPALGGSRWQLQGTAYASFVAYNDRAFEDGVERYEQNVEQRPARLSVGVLRPGRVRLRLAYELGLTRYRPSRTTAPSFAVPAGPPVHGLRASLEVDRGAWTAGIWASAAARQHWRAWGGGPGGPPVETPRSFQRLGVEATRAFVLGPRAVLRFDGAWVGGRSLDRFSRFSFDAVDNRLRGYPSASLRYDRGAALRTLATVSAAPGVRVSALVDVARVHDPSLGEGGRSYPGVGAVVDFPLPFRTLASADWGYGFEGRDREGGRGTHVFRATLYKLF